MNITEKSTLRSTLVSLISSPLSTRTSGLIKYIFGLYYLEQHTNTINDEVLNIINSKEVFKFNGGSSFILNNTPDLPVEKYLYLLINHLPFLTDIENNVDNEEHWTNKLNILLFRNLL